MSESTTTAPLIEQLLRLLEGGQAHATLDEAVRDFPPELRGVVPAHLPYSAWQLLEHLRITQKDILDFCAPPEGGYRPLEWPRKYWPPTPAPQSDESWEQAYAAIRADAHTFGELLKAPAVDLYTPFAWGDGQNLLREALLLADHNSYHIGEFIVVRRLLGAWKK